MPRITYRRLADADLVQITQYLTKESPAAAERFIAAAQSSIQKLAQWPGLGAKRRSRSPRLKGLRSWPIRRFRNYLIFYIPIESGIEIVRIIHGARRIGPLLREQ